MSLLDAYMDGSLVLASVAAKKPKVQAKAAVQPKKKPAPKAKPKAPPGHPSVAEIEQDLELHEEDAEADMDAALSAMDEGGGATEEDPFASADGSSSPSADASAPSASAPSASAPAAAASPPAASTESAPVASSDGGYGGYTPMFMTKEFSTVAAPAGGAPPYSSPVSPMRTASRMAAPTSTMTRSASTATTVAAPVASRTTSVATRTAAPVATRTSTTSRTSSPTISRTGTTALRTSVRGDEPLPFIIASPIADVPPEAWTRFVIAVRNGRDVGAVSDSNELGMFALKPRRLGDLNLLKNLRTVRAPNGRMVWTGDFAPPMSAHRFLSDPAAQYRAFCASMQDYLRKLRSGEIDRPDGGRPNGMTLSGVLAVLHRCGPSGLKTWNNENDRFPDTTALYGRANGIF